MMTNNNIYIWKVSEVIGITNASIKEIEKNFNSIYREIEYPPIYFLPGIKRYFNSIHFETIKMVLRKNMYQNS